MKRKHLVMILLFLVLCLGSCQKSGKAFLNDTKKLMDTVKGKTFEEIHELLGEPDAQLSGFFGDVYSVSSGLEIVFYYDGNGIVERVLTSFVK